MSPGAYRTRATLLARLLPVILAEALFFAALIALTFLV